MLTNLAVNFILLVKVVVIDNSLYTLFDTLHIYGIGSYT